MPGQDLNSGYERLEAQIKWYDEKSKDAQFRYKTGRTIIMVCAAGIPLVSIFELNFLSAFLGSIILVSEGFQQLNQWQHNWITYRSTCEALRHEKYTYIEKTDPYDIKDRNHRRRVLVERVESLISTEHSKWIASQEKAAETSPNAETRLPRSPN